MFRRIALLVVAVFMMMIVAEGVQAQGGTDPFWQASYWDNRYLAGSPVLQRREYSINYNWGDDEPPGLDIDDDTFSARWVSYIESQCGSIKDVKIVPNQLSIDNYASC